MLGDHDFSSLSFEMDEEFGTEAVVTPMLSRPNMRAGADPNRPGYTVVGIFHEMHDMAGDVSSANTKTRKSDGLHEVDIPSTIATFSAERACFAFPPTQGDLIELRQICRIFRVLGVRYEMRTRTVLVLEDIKRPPMA